ncbi:MAG: pyridoxamine 5'-phosphate oxidase [Deltaproteobacteria bacterium]|nr:pyridoxamine 5'-phosphate oxidase [Deltaproteobacteria bacterium]
MENENLSAGIPPLQPPLEPIGRPFELFGQVFSEACDSGAVDPNAMILSTVDSQGAPSSRVVLLKDFDEKGFVFYTNLESRKGREIAANQKVALLFFWRDLHRQVRIEGSAEAVSAEEADTYFASRPHGSQIGAWASQQSRSLSGRAKLVQEVAKVEARFLGREVKRPPHWSGFRVVPSYFEFWQAGAFRLHERNVYEWAGEGWRSLVLYP